MRLRLARHALADAKRKKTWWLRNRDAADLFEQELDETLARRAAELMATLAAETEED